MRSALLPCHSFISAPYSTEVGAYMHGAEGEMVCRLTNDMIPYFNAGIYKENKAKIGKVEEVFGPSNKIYFTIKPDTGVSATAFEVNDKVYIGTDKLLPLSRFTGTQKGGGGRSAGGRGGGRGAPGGRGVWARGTGRGQRRACEGLQPRRGSRTLLNTPCTCPPYAMRCTIMCTHADEMHAAREDGRWGLLSCYLRV
ncbi:Gar1/Naf1 RNA binding region-domain-containing protein [Ochromonadaceae sp. CCMP2298]|nr:Gar1/Naf1 RNA binding region-domain-containing protein [Ochromonadaceae sp. CCMP2298]